MKNVVNFEFTDNCRRNEKVWLVRCPDCKDYGYITAETCHDCYINAMALNNKAHKGHNCKEGLYYRLQRSEGNLL